ncbi:hypothetical protein [Streptomyces sp. NPDC051014]|uniref:hypothetical protein n=1 Tax=Streptomyces sp. NPDC051014 TaxID=3155751 RepID=UPI0034089D2E
MSRSRTGSGPAKRSSEREILPDGVILDCTLREGPYEVAFDGGDMRAIAHALTSSGIDHIEVGAETGLASRADVDDAAIVTAVRESEPQAVIGVIAGTDTATLDDIRRVADAGADFVRVAADAPRWRDALPVIAAVRSLGLVATFNAIKCHSVTAAQLALLARETTEAGADIVYLVDSAGTLVPTDVTERTAVVRDAGARAGFHGHDNLTLAVANSLAAFAAGASVVDGTLRGAGRSAGNAQLEVLVAALRKQAWTAPVDGDALSLAAEELVAVRRAHDRGVGFLDLCMGEGGFHSAGLADARGVADAYGVSLGPLLRETGRLDPSGPSRTSLEKVAKAQAAGEL